VQTQYLSQKSTLVRKQVDFVLPGALSQVTCEDHVKWITDEKSRKDRSVTKSETMNTKTLEI